MQRLESVGVFCCPVPGTGSNGSRSEGCAAAVLKEGASPLMTCMYSGTCTTVASGTVIDASGSKGAALPPERLADQPKSNIIFAHVDPRPVCGESGLIACCEGPGPSRCKLRSLGHKRALARTGLSAPARPPASMSATSPRSQQASCSIEKVSGEPTSERTRSVKRRGPPTSASKEVAVFGEPTMAQQRRTWLSRSHEDTGRGPVCFFRLQFW